MAFQLWFACQQEVSLVMIQSCGLGVWVVDHKEHALKSLASSSYYNNTLACIGSVHSVDFAGPLQKPPCGLELHQQIAEF